MKKKAFSIVKKTFRKQLIIIVTILLVIASYAVSLSVIADRTISFVPSRFTNFLYSYLETCEKHPEKAVTYTYFTTEIEQDAYEHSPLRILDYELLGAEKINDDLYAFTLQLQKEVPTYPKRYYFVGLIDGKLRLMVNVYNIPESLREGLREEDFTLTEEDLNGGIQISPDSLID